MVTALTKLIVVVIHPSQGLLGNFVVELDIPEDGTPLFVMEDMNI